MKKVRTIIGLMSGTSVDGIDAAVVRFTGVAPDIKLINITHFTMPWPRRVRERLLAVMAPASAPVREICELHMITARYFADAAARARAAAKIQPHAVEAIGSHGQTICHLPPMGRAGRIPSLGSTLQLGDISAIAALTGIPVVGNFRSADMAVGGQGAPLVPWVDNVLLRHASLSRAVQNIGGIANVTLLPPAGSAAPIVAFDTGPGNMLMDGAVSLGAAGKEKFDKNGRMAAAGQVDAAAVKRLQAMPYFRRKPPKSTGRELFGEQLAAQLLAWCAGRPAADAVATATRLTAWSIADAYKRFLPALPDELIVCGGGADNPTLLAMLAEELPGMPIRRIDELGIANKAREAMAFALLAAATLDGVPANVPGVTGARRPVVLGEVARPLVNFCRTYTARGSL